MTISLRDRCDTGQVAAGESLLSALIDCPHKLAHLLAALYAVQEGLTDAGAASEQGK